VPVPQEAQMKVRLTLSSVAAAVIAFMLSLASSYAAPAAHYLITNNDVSPNSATFYQILGNGELKQTAVVETRGTGVFGIGDVATKRVSILDNRLGQCAFISDAGTVDVAGISIPALRATGTFKAQSTDSAPFGMPIGNNGIFLYAGLTGSNTLATYRILRDCKLEFIQDVSASGLFGGILGRILDFSVHKNILVASFADGSIESFNISAGVPVSNGDEQFWTGNLQNGNLPAGVDITSDGHFAIFGGTNVPPVVEVSDISSGKLEPTVVNSNLGNGGSPAAIWLSPDESLLYLSNFSPSTVTAAFFDKTTGAVTFGCISPTLRGPFNFAAGLATAARRETSSTILFVAEPEVDIGIVRVHATSENCSLSETPRSPVRDSQESSQGTLESIGVFPPRSF